MRPVLTAALGPALPAACVLCALPAAAQTVSLGYAADVAQASGSSADYSATLSASAAASTLALTSGVPATDVDLGVLSFVADGFGPNNVNETIPFSFTRPLSFTLNGSSPVSQAEALTGTLGLMRGGGFGQYLLTDLKLDGASASTDFGSLGTLQTDFQPGEAFFDGLGGEQTVALRANFTLLAPAAAVPEPAPLALLALGIPTLGAVFLRARRRHGA